MAAVSSARRIGAIAMRSLADTLVCIFVIAGYAAAADVRTIAGTGKAGYSGDGSSAVKGELNNPYGITQGPDGALYICEVDNHVVRRLDLKSHTLSTVVG